MAVAFLQPKDYVAQVAPDSTTYPETEALAYTRWLATHHYENFQVVSFLLPRHQHQDFYNVYSFCRWADDLGDEMGDCAESLKLLAWWRSELASMYRGDASHPVFIALRSTVEKFQIPIDPFDQLIQAFEHDQRVTRYQEWDDVLGYCVNSANPVGHLVLYLCGYRDASRQQLSDYTCTALQLANFWQDVFVDYGKGRIYLPLEDLRRFGVTGEDIAERRATPQFLAMMKFEVERARDWFARGLPLVKMVDGEIAVDLELFSRGGQEILNAIERQGFDVLKARPEISKSRKLMLVLRAAMGKLL